MAVNVQPKPTAAFALSLLAGITTLITAFVASAVTMLIVPGFSSMILVWGSIAGLVCFVGSWLLYSNAAQRKLGSILVLVFSLISGNFISPILGLIGGFLGYSFKGNTTNTSSNTSSSSRGYNPP